MPKFFASNDSSQVGLPLAPEPPFGRLAALLDGRRNPVELAERLQLPLPVVAHLLQRMAAMGLIEKSIERTEINPRWSAEAERQTLPRLLPLLGRHVELLIDLAPLFDLPVHVLVCRAAQAAGGESFSGCGSDLLAALRRTLGEAAERLSSRFHGDEDLVESEGPAVVRRLASRSENSRATDGRRFVKACALGERSFDWLVPAAWCYRDFPDAGEDRSLHNASTIGCAAGPSFDAAAVRALLELAERDAAAIWWYRRVRRPAIDPSHLAGEDSEAILGWLDAQGRRPLLLDLSNDLGIPVAVAIAHDAAGRPDALGLGAGLTTGAAAATALRELLQIDCSLRLRARRAEEPAAADAMRRLLSWRLERESAEDSHLLPDPGAASAALNCPGPGDEAAALAWLAARIAGAGLAGYLVPLTRSDIGISVVRAVVPGLCGTEPGEPPARLFAVPRSLNWRHSQGGDAEINPQVFPI